MNRNSWIAVVLLLGAGLTYLLLGSQPTEPAAGTGTSSSGAAPVAADSSGAGEAAPAGGPSLAEAGRTNLEAAGPVAGDAASLQRAEPPGALRLRLVDSQNRPVRDVTVTLVQRSRPEFEMPGLVGLGLGRGDEAAKQPDPRLRPSADGQVRFAEVPSRTPLTLEVRGDYWTRRDLRVAPLLPGEARELGEVVLSPGVLLSGVVRDAAGAPAAGATVELQPDGERFGFAMGGSVAEATTEADGRYRLTGLSPGRFRLSAEAPGTVAAKQVVEIEAAPREQTADLRLGTGGKVTGRIVDAAGRPLAEARVALAPADGFAAFRWRKDTVIKEGVQVGADGRFELSGLPPAGRTRVMAAAQGFALGRSAAVYDGAEIELALTLTRALEGRVVDSAGRPVAAAAVRLEPLSPPSGPMMFRSDSATSGADGTFRIDEITAGDYALIAQAPAGEARREPITIGERNEPVELRLSGGDALIVSVKDVGGVPVRNAEVRLEAASGDEVLSDDVRGDCGGGGRRVRMVRSGGGGGGFKGRTDANGEIRFLGLKTGPYQVEVDAERFAAAKKPVQRSGEDGQRTEVVLHPASSLIVRVIDTIGNPVAGAQLELRAADPASGFGARSERADDWGIAVWDELEPGDYAVHQGADDSMMTFSSGGDNVGISFGGAGSQVSDAPSLVIELSPGESADEKLVIASKALLKVRVTRFGDPVAGATVSLGQPGGDGLGLFGGFGGGDKSAKTDGDGWASLPPCDTGSYQLSAQATPQSPATRKEITLGSGPQEAGVALASGEISGVVLGPEGPVANARVHLARGAGADGGAQHGVMMMSVAIGSDGDAEPAIETLDFSPGQTTVNTAADGSFRFRDVPGGIWHLRMDATGYSRLQSDDIRLDDGARVDLGLFELTGAGTLRGRILGLPAPDPNGFSMNMVQLLDEAGERAQFSAVRADGRYSFKDVKPGLYKLEMNVGGEMHTSDPVVVHAGPPTEFDFNL
ncbi:MAG: carboxypeptidase regulatory-like domain-containing protein [Planctomycetes bacterium]|nr:carboxypeptidase regulatory-like domain-containing protein [Planctomycetota bacterium]